MSFPSICKSNLTSHFISSYSIKSLQATNSLLRSSSSSSLISTPPSNLSRSPSHLFPIPKPLSKPSINIQKSRFMTSNSISASKIHFSSFDVTSQVFFSNSSKSVHGIVNLKPIVPCHVLLIPKKCYKSFSEVPLEEVAQLFQSVQLVSSVLKRELKADALTISIQDGEEAGQSVPHLHVHILPRRKGDFEPNDKIYPLLESFGHSLSAMQAQREKASVAPDDEDRRPRTDAEMKSEADWLRSLM